ncbi:acylneuraminate cytidylyltransferase family protein [Lysinibacillus sp. FSL K6-3209]|uniref:acylneuraminate cytidylyltransferase family protein n=1 Tax=Lysinibacillus sp. FSL K6-3209 TaxID=2921497 RepID=UPI0030DA1966
MKPKVLAIIPARGGSKGVPRKNIKVLAGKPLIAWTIEEAKKSKYITRTILSSDNEEIIQIAKEYGCDVPFVRPTELAQDDTPGITAVLHALEQCEGYEYVVLLQPTSPFRTVEDIDNCIEYTINQQAKFCVSVTEAEQSPYWMYTIENGKMKPIIEQDKLATRRQDLPNVYVLNGAIYVARVEDIIEKKTFLTEETTSFIMSNDNSLDIDTVLDFEISEYLIGKS